MKHKAIILLALALLALTPITQIETDQEIRAEYQNPIFNQQTQITYGDGYTSTVNSEIVNSLDVQTQEIQLVWGTSRYQVLASDQSQNYALHEQAINRNSIIVLQQPSKLGASQNTLYDLEVYTQQSAVCEWRFWTPQNSMEYRPLSTQPTQNHLYEEFGEEFQFDKEELIPLEIRCSNDYTTDTARFTVGWKEEPQEIQHTFTSSPAFSRSQEILLEANSNSLSSCDLVRQVPTLTLRSRATANHLFRIPATNSLWELRCTDVRGVEQQQKEIGIPYKQNPKLQATLESEQIIIEEDYQLIVRTNKPATCRVADQRLGALEQGILHQKRITLQPLDNQLSITCDADGQTATLEPLIYYDRDEPTVNIASGTETCGDDLILDYSTQDVAYIVVEAGGLAYIRQVSEDGRVQTYQPGMGDATSVQVTAYKTSGLTSTATFNNIPESEDETCKYREDQCIRQVGEQSCPGEEDVTKPQSSNAGHTTELPGSESTFYVTFNDETALEPSGEYVFSTNVTGSWENDSAISFASTPQTVQTAKTLPSTPETTVGYRWYATDDAGNQQTTSIYTLTTTNPEETPTGTDPEESNAGHTTEIPGLETSFYVTWDDAQGLEPSGEYVFSTNVTGSWENDSAISFASTPQTVQTAKTLPSTPETTVGYRWYATDDQANNAQTPIYTLTTIRPNIITGDPPGITDERFNLTYYTEYNSTCVINIPPTDPDTTVQSAQQQPSTIHEFIDFHQYVQPGATEYQIVCTDPADQDTQKNDTVYWQLPPPQFTLSANPSVITNATNRETLIRAVSEEDTQCSFEQGPFSEEFKQIHDYTATVLRGERTINVTCRNAHFEELSKQIGFRENIPLESGIEFITMPNITNQTTFEIALATPLRTSCTLEAQNQTQTIQTSNQRRHAQEITLEEGDSQLNFRCIEDGVNQRILERSHNITVDSTPPTIQLKSSQLTCGLNEYALPGSVRDNTEVDYVIIQFAGRVYRTQQLPYRLQGLELQNGQDYELTITAYDIAANPSNTTVDTITAHSETDGACDENPPTGAIHTKTIQTGIEVSVFCEDDLSCDTTYGFGSVTPGGTCDLSDKTFPEVENATFLRGETILIEEDQKICWEVRDLAGNTDKGERTITLGAVPNTTNSCEEDIMCSDGEISVACGETGVDCGGFVCGNKCAQGGACESNSDCASGVCAADGTCLEATCNDDIRNAEETDTDCGGPTCDACGQGERCNQNSDCEQGLVCSFGTCMSEENEREQKEPETQEPADIEPEEGASLLGILLIIFGALSMMGGGGYIYYEKEYATPTTTQESPTFGGPTNTSQPKPRQEPKTDFSKSILREEAREKRRAKRVQDREQLLGEFDEPQQQTKKPETHKQTSTPQTQQETTPKKTTQAPKEPEQTDKKQGTDVFDELEDIAKDK